MTARGQDARAPLRRSFQDVDNCRRNVLTGRETKAPGRWRLPSHRGALRGRTERDGEGRSGTERDGAGRTDPWPLLAGPSGRRGLHTRRPPWARTEGRSGQGRGLRSRGAPLGRNPRGHCAAPRLFSLRKPFIQSVGFRGLKGKSGLSAAYTSHAPTQGSLVQQTSLTSQNQDINRRATRQVRACWCTCCPGQVPGARPLLPSHLRELLIASLSSFPAPRGSAGVHLEAARGADNTHK